MKFVKVLNKTEGIKFGFEERTVIVSKDMAVEDAERLQKDYPGVYVQVVETIEQMPVPVPVEAPAQTTQTGKIAKAADSTKTV